MPEEQLTEVVVEAEEAEAPPPVEQEAAPAEEDRRRGWGTFQRRPGAPVRNRPRDGRVSRSW